MWFLHDGTGKTLYCLASEELAWHFQNYLQGWMNDFNVLLLCFRTKMSACDFLFVFDRVMVALHINLSQLILGDVHDFLRGTGALDRSVWEREDGVAGPEVLDGLPRLADVLVGVVGAHARSRRLGCYSVVS